MANNFLMGLVGLTPLEALTASQAENWTSPGHRVCIHVEQCEPFVPFSFGGPSLKVVVSFQVLAIDSVSASIIFSVTQSFPRPMEFLLSLTKNG